MRIMNAVCCIVVVLVLSCHGHKTVSGTCSQNLENALFEDLLSMMMKIKGTGKGTDHQDETFSAFSASLTATKTLGAGEIVKFNKVITNVNNDYDPSTGIYTAPKPGVFQFSCTVMTPSGKTLHVGLWKNDTKTVTIYPGQTGYNMGTQNTILELKKGDKVYIKQFGSGKEIFSLSVDSYSVFSGYLIR
ncbi:C1QL [Mytilus coruscus]|uniref:C1QL n=1 Tax=Mytilus coruscus TaxID=42192 RepID=A0A6J8EGR1_MYTCO|nr:C1QL [Mytilus coruscus]